MAEVKITPNRPTLVLPFECQRVDTGSEEPGTAGKRTGSQVAVREIFLSGRVPVYQDVQANIVGGPFTRDRYA